MADYPRANPARWWKSRHVGSADRSPAAMFISPLRRFASLIMLVFLVTLIVGVWWITNPRRISAMAQILLTRLIGGRVTIGEGHLSFGGTLLLSNVSVNTADATEAGRVFSADQLEMRFDWLSLLAGQLRATQITAVHPKLYLTQNATTGRWNFEQIQQQGGTEEHGGGPAVPGGGATAITNLPVILLRGAQAELSEVVDGKVNLLGQMEVEAQMIPNGAYASRYEFQIVQTADLKIGKSRELAGYWDMSQSSFEATIHDIALTEGLRNVMPRQVRQAWEEHNLRGNIKELRFSVDRQRGAVVEVQPDRVSLVQEVDTNSTGGPRSYVVPMTDISGWMSFAIGSSELTIGMKSPPDHDVELQTVHGQAMGFHFLLSGNFRGMAPEAPFTLSLDLPDNVVGEPYPALVDASPAAQDIVQRLRLKGRLDIKVKMERQTWNGNVHVFDGQVVCHDATARFVHFPFALEKVNGTVTFDDDTVKLNQMTAMADKSLVYVDGTVGTTGLNRKIDILVWSNDAYFDDRTEPCIPEDFVSVWDAFDPVGHAAFSCHVTRENRQDALPHTEVEIEPIDIRARYEGFPYPIEHIHGKFSIGGEAAIVDRLEGQLGAGRGTVVFSGEVKYPHGNLAAVAPNIKLECRNVTIDPQLLMCLPDTQQSWVRAIDVTGTAGIDGTIQRGPDGGPMVTGVVTLADGTLQPRSGAWKIGGIGAEVAFSPERIGVERFTGLIGNDGGKLNVAAEILMPADGAAPRTVAAHGDFSGLGLVATALSVVPAEWAGTWNQMAPSGKLDGTFRIGLKADVAALGSLTGPAAEGGKPGVDFRKMITEFSLGLVLKDGGLTLPKWPDPLSKINGQAVITLDGVEVKKLVADAGAMHFSTQASYTFADSGLKVKAFTADAATIPSTWVALLPGDVAGFIRALEPSGAVHVDMRSLEHVVKGEASSWVFDGDVVFSDLSTKAGVVASAKTFTLSGKGAWDIAAGGLDFSGKLSTEDLVVVGRKLEGFGATVTGSAASKKFELSEVSATVAGGTLEGNLAVLLGDQPKYEANMVLNDAELTGLLLGPTPTDEEKKKMGSGRLTATLAVQEQFGKGAENDRTGRGDLVIRDGTIYNVPLSMGLLQIATLRLPMSSAFNSANVTYYLRNNQVTFEKILLESPGVNLAGAGSMMLKDQAIDLRFVTESPNDWNLPGIGVLMPWVRNQLLQVEVTGTTQAPNVRAIPLDVISRPLELLLPKPSPATQK